MLQSNTPIQITNARILRPYWSEHEKPVKRQVKLPASVFYPAGTCLGEVFGTSEVQTVTITGSPTGGTFTLTYSGSTTAAIAFDATAATVEAALNALTNLSPNARYSLAMAGSPTGGTFRLGYGGFMTTTIAYNATAAVVQAALEALPSIGSGNIAVTGTDLTGTLYLTFQGNLAGIEVPSLTSNPFGLVPTTASATLTAVVTGGGLGAVQVSGAAGGPYTVTFSTGLSSTNVAAMTASGASLTGGTSPGVTIATATGGVAGTSNLMKKSLPTATDGSQTIRAFLEYDCSTDSSGNITYGQQNTGEPFFGTTYTTAPAFAMGIFNVSDLVGLDSRCYGNNVVQMVGNGADGLVRLR